MPASSGYAHFIYASRLHSAHFFFLYPQKGSPRLHAPTVECGILPCGGPVCPIADALEVRRGSNVATVEANKEDLYSATGAGLVPCRCGMQRLSLDTASCISGDLGLPEHDGGGLSKVLRLRKLDCQLQLVLCSQAG